jgi:gliding-associated putative ABC transporter substrate-binding component GldG
VLSSFPQTIDTVSAPGIRKQVILGSSSYSRTLQTPALVEWRSIKTEEDLTQFNKKNKAVAVLLEGKFRSALANRISSAELQQLAVEYRRPFLSAAASDNSMIVISDGDILTNAVSQQDGPMAMGMNSYTRQQFANRDFISNCLFYLTGGASIMEARAKTFRLRLLDKEQLENNKLFWQMLNILLPLAFPLALYFIYGCLRKRKYAMKG